MSLGMQQILFVECLNIYIHLFVDEVYINNKINFIKVVEFCYLHLNLDFLKHICLQKKSLFKKVDNMV